MKNINLFLSLVILFSAADNVQAQSFFWSDIDIGNGAPVDADFVVNAAAGESGRTFLYYNPEGQSLRQGGFDLDFSWESSGIAAFTDASALNFDILFDDIVVDQRWSALSTPSVDEDSVEFLLAVHTVPGTGLLVEQSEAAGGVFLDTGSVGEFFQVGFIDWLAVGPGEVSLQIDEFLVVDNGVAITPKFRGLTISVPEPTAAAVLVFGALSLCIRRRSLSH